MKRGTRVLGIAESYRRTTSTLCGAVVSGDGFVDGLGFRQITVGGTDATSGVISLWEDVGRPDVQFLLVNGVALAWYNIVDLQAVAEAIPVPVMAVTYEESDGLHDAIADAFDGSAARRRIDQFEALPPRRRYEVGDTPIYVRAVGAEEVDIATVLGALMPAGGRPEPVRVARIAARAADRYRERTAATEGN